MFIVRNPNPLPFILQDKWVYLEFSPGESGVDLEEIFSHEELYNSSLPPVGALWLALQDGSLLRRNNADTADLPFGTGPGTALYDPVWRYAPNQGQWEALVGSVPIPSDSNRYVTELDFGVSSNLTTFNGTLTTLFEVPVPENSIMMIQTWVTAARIGGVAGTVGDGATFIKLGTVKNVGNIVTLKITESAYTFRDQPQWRVTFDILGTKVRVRVQGAANNSVTWTGKTRTLVQEF